MSPARATSSAVERWIPWRGRGRNGGRERKGKKEGEGKRKERGRRRKKGRRRGRRITMKRLSTNAIKLWSPLPSPPPLTPSPHPLTLGNCFPFPVRTKRGRENGWLSERLDVDLLLSVSSLLTGSPALGSKVNNNILISFC